MWWKYLLFGFGILLGLGLIAGGCILFWQADKNTTCKDWELQSPYYPLYDCDATSSDLIAMSKCNTACYCEYLYNYTCLDDGPHVVSPTFIGWGIGMLIVGIIVLVAVGIIMKISKLCCCC